MTNKDRIVIILGKNNDNNEYKDILYITNLYYEYYPNIIEKRRNQYNSSDKPKTEKELYYQIVAELGSTISYKDIKTNYVNVIKDKSINSRKIFNLSDEGLKYYKELVNKFNDLDDNISEDDNIEIIENDYILDINDNKQIGFVYLFRSKTFTNVHKTGLTIRTIQDRVLELKKDPKYGVFDLEPVMYIKCNNPSLVEQILLKFFEDFRLCKKSNLCIDTELFKDHDNIEIEFEMFFNMIKNIKRYDATLIKL